MMQTYHIETRALSAEEGGGFLAWAPDLPGCMSDGDSREEAEIHCRDAIQDWLDQAQREGINIPPIAGSRAVA